MSTRALYPTRGEVAALIAADIPDGAIVNLGIGAPTMVADMLPADREIVLHTENGLLGMGPAATEGTEDADLINAGKIYVTEVPGAAYFHHADSFAMMRGGHIDICVLGAFQVSTSGDLANWRTADSSVIPGVGGAMDLAAGAKEVYVLMDLFARDGTCKLVETCTYPLTATGCVNRVYTDRAVFAITTSGPPEVLAIFGGDDFESLQQLVDIPLIDHRPSPTPVA